MIGVFGLITLPTELLSAIIFVIVAVYSTTYIFNTSFNSKNKALDIFFLMLGGYISGTSLIGAPLIIAVLANHINRHQLRDSLFVLWFILVTIKMTAFIYVGIDLQLIHHLWLLPAAGIGHLIGLRFHDKMLQTDTKTFYRGLGIILLLTSFIGLWRSVYS
jgi:predicted exporter